MDFEIAEFQRRTESCKETASSSEHCNDDFCVDGKEDRFVYSNPAKLDSLGIAASAAFDRPL